MAKLNNNKTSGKDKKGKSKKMEIRLDDELYEKIRLRAEAKGTKRAEIARELMNDGLYYQNSPAPLLSKEVQVRICREVIANCVSTPTTCKHLFQILEALSNREQEGSTSLKVILIGVASLMITMIAICVFIYFGK